MSKFNLTNLAVNMYCPGNVVQMDDAGLPSVMVWIPAFRLCDVLNTTDESLHPAFIVNGVHIPGFYFSKYQNVVHNDVAYSLPGEAIPDKMAFNQAESYSEAKGYGWHLTTAAEWAAVALWCKKNRSMPYGNNNYGKDSRETEYKAVPTSYNGDGTIAFVATGTGPLTWSHDKSMSGIWDLNGNGAEYLGGIRLVWGELQILDNNDAADPDNPQNTTSTCWKAINAATGALVDPECLTTDNAAKLSGSTIKLDLNNSVTVYTTTITNTVNVYGTGQFSKITCTGEVSDAAKMRLRALALLPDEGASVSDYDGDEFYIQRDLKEVMFYRGGSNKAGASCGVFQGSFAIQRGSAATNACFRAAYIPNI